MYSVVSCTLKIPKIIFRISWSFLCLGRIFLESLVTERSRGCTADAHSRLPPCTAAHTRVLVVMDVGNPQWAEHTVPENQEWRRRLTGGELCSNTSGAAAHSLFSESFVVVLWLSAWAPSTKMSYLGLFFAVWEIWRTQWKCVTLVFPHMQSGLFLFIHWSLQLSLCLWRGDV